MALYRAVPTQVSKDMGEATRKVLHLYRSCLREVPAIIANYELKQTPSEMVPRIRADFEKHREVREPMVVDMLVFKGLNDLEETKLIWKQRGHIRHYFRPKEEPSPHLDLHAFLEGADMHDPADQELLRQQSSVEMADWLAVEVELCAAFLTPSLASRSLLSSLASTRAQAAGSRRRQATHAALLHVVDEEEEEEEEERGRRVQLALEERLRQLLTLLGEEGEGDGDGDGDGDGEVVVEEEMGVEGLGAVGGWEGGGAEEGRGWGQWAGACAAAGSLKARRARHQVLEDMAGGGGGAKALRRVAREVEERRRRVQEEVEQQRRLLQERRRAGRQLAGLAQRKAEAERRAARSRWAMQHL